MEAEGQSKEDRRHDWDPLSRFCKNCGISMEAAVDDLHEAALCRGRKDRGFGAAE